MKCPDCGCKKVWKNGFNNQGSRFKCSKCKKTFSNNIQNESHVIIEEKLNEQVMISKDIKIKTLDDLLKFGNVDLKVWNVDRNILNFWGNSENPNHQVKAWLTKIVPDKQVIPTIKKINVEIPDIKYSKRKVYGKSKKSLVVGDAQVGFRRDVLTGELTPFHDRKAMDLTLNLINKIKPDEIIIAGDMLDFAEAGKYLKEPEFYFTFQPAIYEFANWLGNIRRVTPNSKIVYMIGNHEVRLANYIKENMLFAYGLKRFKGELSLLSLRNLLDLDSMEIEIIEEYPGGQYWINDNLRVIHGEYVQVAKELSNSKVSTIQGHNHRIEKMFKTAHGRDGIEKMFVESLGCLCHIDGRVPGVKKQPNWQQSVILVETMEDFFNTQQIVYHSGRTLYNGELLYGEDNTKEIEELFKRNI